jgi:hypothetical protein
MKEGNTVVTILNLSRKPVTLKPDLSDFHGDFHNPLNGEIMSLPLADSLKLAPWETLILVK